MALIAAWVTLCASLRFKRITNFQKQMGFSDRDSLALMTNNQAQLILKNIIEFEFPKMYILSLQFAIFKTYGIETMSKLIVATKNLADAANAQKRFSLNPPTSERALKAISRMNYLHSRYVAAGQISNADFLYTLAVCITEPIRFMRLYEWRPLTDMEVCAIGTHWKAIGDAMDIQYKGFLRQESWANGIEFVEDITAWAAQYEVDEMKPAKVNLQASSQLTEMMLFHVPSFAKSFAREVLYVLMGDRVRAAFCFPEPGIVASLAAYAALVTRRFVVRHLMLPRFTPVVYFSGPDPDTGRILHHDYLVHPYYNPATVWNRWGPIGLATRLLGGTVPGPEKMMPQGFLFEDIGPREKMGKGSAEMTQCVEALKSRRRDACPFTGGSS
ncbi:mycophenolic acid synthesis protein B [Colletotrichum spaethianum]|uniref:Mycophenolic acid synthesis protein B n=1 Tax=Colletotrichum spaethianum TaxID=700344 RepID=A0AA37L8K3_9PEZI|nr:mycophenolic acid synthesis protein B [Colletotrichum spaethianum]GKT41410.1 mycophenolic acid synthesis protein B [Colletotrichum spaethianum]